MDSMIRSGLNIAPIITHRLPYTEFREGFEAMNSASPARWFWTGLSDLSAFLPCNECPGFQMERRGIF